MLINVKGKTEVLKDLETAKRLINEASEILYRMPTKIEFEVNGTENKLEPNRIAPDNQ